MKNFVEKIVDNLSILSYTEEIASESQNELPPNIKFGVHVFRLTRYYPPVHQ